VAGANVPDFKLLAATLEAIVIERPEPSEESPQHLCLDKGYVTRGRSSSRRCNPVATETPHKAHRRGEARLSQGEAIPGEEMGGGAYSGLAFEMPLHPGTLREEGHQLSGTHQGRLYSVVVPSSASFIPFEIVSK
jgi:hypothetical protein